MTTCGGCGIRGTQITHDNEFAPRPRAGVFYFGRTRALTLGELILLNRLRADEHKRNAVQDVAWRGRMRPYQSPPKVGKMPPLLEIKGLAGAVNDVRASLKSIRSSAAGLQASAAGLKAELDDVTKQIEQHRSDLKFEAETLGNSGSSAS